MFRDGPRTFRRKAGDTVLRFHAKITRTVRILMIAPEPFFEPRGTPFSEFHRIRALTALGHQVDLVTYPFGQTVSMPGLRVFRSLRPPLLRRVKIGPSLAKIPLDALLALTAIRRAFSARYDVIHSHEEGGVIGALLAMGQDGALPRRFFGAVHPKNRIPRNNVLLIGAICMAGALIFSYQLGTELLNYGALLAFMGVNLASALLAWRSGGLRQWWPILSSVFGFAVCLFIWLNLGKLALVAGTGW